MSQTLYRKYRPQKFKEIIGQDAVVEALSQVIEKGTVSHSYVFAGSRGTGKTSTARIFASALNTSSNDLYEIDAASNRGIDDIREIRDAVHTLPFESDFKIYIIDEAHMLTKEAWNALLKTLEEPPSHVIFILATTEVEKIPETILSRSQVFAFKKPSLEILAKLISATAKKEGFKIEDEAARLIALLADGSFRDAHGVLQKTISSTKDETITVSLVENVSSLPKRAHIQNIFKALEENDVSKIVETIEKLQEENADPKLFANLLLEDLRKALLIRIDKNKREAFQKELSQETFEALSSLAEKGKAVVSSETLLKLLSSFSEVSFSSLPFVTIELALLSLIEPRLV